MEKFTTTNAVNKSIQLSSTLLTTETSLVLILDYQDHVMEGIRSSDHELIELNGRALAKASKALKVRKRLLSNPYKSHAI